MRRTSVSEGWIIKGHTISQQARALLEQCGDSIQVSNLEGFYRAMLNSEDYLNNLILDFENDEQPYWVDLQCEGMDADGFSVEDYVNAWQEQTDPKLLALVGQFGMGKTWFCRYYAAQMARRHLKEGNSRIPILISLQGWQEVHDMEAHITTSLVNEASMSMMNYETFTHLSRHGRLLLIFDGFDQMEQHVELRVAKENYNRIVSMALDRNKVIFTSRPLFFENTESLQSILDTKKVDVLSLGMFQPDQIREALTKRMPDEQQQMRQWLYNQIDQISELKNLASRPVMIQIICQSFPPGVDNDHLPKHINSAALYRRCIEEGWVKKACRKVPAQPDEVLIFLRDLACEMFEMPGNGITKSEFLKRAHNAFNSSELIEELERLFTRDRHTDNYIFPHSSFMEYFVAEMIAQGLKEGRYEALFRYTLTDVVVVFLKEIMQQEIDRSSLEAQNGILQALFGAQAGNQIGRVVRFLTALGTGNPVVPVLHIITFVYQEVTSTDERKNLEKHARELPEPVIKALGTKDHLAPLESNLLSECPVIVSLFLLSLWGNRSIETHQALPILSRVLGNPAMQRDARLHAVVVIAKRQGEQEFQTLVDTAACKDIPLDIRQECLNQLNPTVLSTDLRQTALRMLCEVIADEEDELRYDSVSCLARFNSNEALIPLLDILKDVEHRLWYPTCWVLFTTSVLGVADLIEQEIVPSLDHRSIMELAQLQKLIERIRINAQQ
jgi:hypothetical protein